MFFLKKQVFISFYLWFIFLCAFRLLLCLVLYVQPSISYWASIENSDMCARK